MGCALVHRACFLSIWQNDRYDSAEKSYPQRGHAGDLFQGNARRAHFRNRATQTDKVQRWVSAGRVSRERQIRMNVKVVHFVDLPSLCPQFVLTLPSVPDSLETRMVAGFR